MTGEAATRPPIRVLVVDDSAFMRTALSRMIASESGFEVAATACSGSDALDKIPSLDPDVITLDVEMPGLDGLQTLRCIMRRFPRPVIMISAATEKDADNTFDALAAGAFDYVPKQLSLTLLDIVHIRPDLIAKIRAAAQSRNSLTVDALSRKLARSCQSEDCNAALPSVPAIVALGTSTGGS
jgi:two-component system chemotaxis response regulator CheB